jgi:hypothetical protein
MNSAAMDSKELVSSASTSSADSKTQSMMPIFMNHPIKMKENIEKGDTETTSIETFSSVLYDLLRSFNAPVDSFAAFFEHANSFFVFFGLTEAEAITSLWILEKYLSILEEEHLITFDKTRSVDGKTIYLAAESQIFYLFSIVTILTIKIFHDAPVSVKKAAGALSLDFETMDKNIIEMFKTLDYKVIPNLDEYEWIKCIVKMETSEERIKGFRKKMLKEKMENYYSKKLEDLQQELKEDDLQTIIVDNCMLKWPIAR